VGTVLDVDVDSSFALLKLFNALGLAREDRKRFGVEVQCNV
jgi:hypothetical protein